MDCTKKSIPPKLDLRGTCFFCAQGECLTALYKKIKSQLDHVLIPEQYTNYENLRYMHTLTFANLYSDHRAVAIRLSKNEID